MTFSGCALSVLLMLAPQTPAQPDFSGRWVLVSPDTAPADIPALLVVQQHMKRTDIQGNPMKPFWHLLTVEGDDSRSGIRSGIHRMGVVGGVAGGIVGRDASGELPSRRVTQESATWERDTLVVTSEEWMERGRGERESYARHSEVWALDRQGRLTITVTDSSGEPRTRTVTYHRERARR